MNYSISNKAIVTLFSTTLLLGACGGTTTNTVDKSQVGALTGAVIGGVAGHQFGSGRGKTAATIAGTILGGYLGGMVGQQMNQNDRRQVGYALNDNRPMTWNNNNTRYTATPGRSYSGSYRGQATECKNVTIDAYIDGKLEKTKANACRVPGTSQWEIMK